jgi:hypothetical protein
MFASHTFIPNWVVVDHLKQSTEFILDKPDFPRIDINSCYSINFNQSCIDFLNNEQNSTKSKFILLKQEGKICKYFVNLSINEEDVEGSLVVYLDRFIELNNKWLNKMIFFGIVGIAGFTIGWNVAKVIQKGINNMILFKNAMVRMVANVDRIRIDVDVIDTNAKKIFWRVEKIESWVERQKATSRY